MLPPMLQPDRLPFQLQPAGTWQIQSVPLLSVGAACGEYRARALRKVADCVSCVNRVDSSVMAIPIPQQQHRPADAESGQGKSWPENERRDPDGRAKDHPHHCPADPLAGALRQAIQPPTVFLGRRQARVLAVVKLGGHGIKRICSVEE